MDLVESTWIELDTQNRNKIIIGCVYKHPSANLNEFHSEMESIMKQFNDNKKQVFILGDINIDLLKYNIHTPTEDYVDMVFSNNFLPLITKPTRITDHSKTLIDHIYMNTQNDLGNVITGILKFDISDHLPVFCTVNVSPKRNDDTFFFRDYKKFNIDHYKHDLESVNWTNLFSESRDLHIATQKTIETIQQIVGRHAPLQQASSSQKKRLRKPWITAGILKSIKRKQKMYSSHFLSKDEKKMKEYKTFSNKLNKIKYIAKKNYYQNQFEKNNNNLKKTWGLIGTIINRKSKENCAITEIERNNNRYTDKTDICKQLRVRA